MMMVTRVAASLTGFDHNVAAPASVSFGVPVRRGMLRWPDRSRGERSGFPLNSVATPPRTHGVSVSDGHGVSPGIDRNDYARRILSEVEAGRGVSQRSLARSAGIALGLTNLVLRNLVRKG